MNSAGSETATGLPPRPVVPAAPLPPEIAFLLGFGLSHACLSAVVEAAGVAGVTADRALLAAGLLSPEAFYRFVAAHLGVPFLHDPLPIAGGVALEEAMGAEIVPLHPNPMGLLFAVAPRGAALALLLERFTPGLDRPSPQVAVTTPRRLAALVRHHHRAALRQAASHSLPAATPRLSALAGWSAGQRLFGFGAGFTVALGLGAAPLATGQALCMALSALFLLMIAVRLLATAGAPPRRAAVGGAAMPARRVPDDALPVYTVVVPLYREAEVAAQLVRSLRGLDYPAARLDIKLVLEDDDAATLEALQAECLPDCFEIHLAPPGHPRTKPRALNVALPFATGSLLVIFDAEDVPEPGQLREAAAAFAAAGPGLGCLQARLAIDNADNSWLTRLFAIEYAALFDVLNPGLARLGLPVALGGTSNHFRTAILRQVGGWDAWNVTEDIDLGIRLARYGFRTAVLEATTFEEAPAGLRAWLGQRRRWQKGWMVTLQTHSRNPGRLFAELGLAGGLTVLGLLGGTVMSSLLWPFFALGVAADALAGALLRPVTAEERAWALLAFLLIGTGTLSLLWPAMLGIRRRDLGGSARWLALLPAYLLLLSWATWAALFETVRRPYSWAKTAHGLGRRQAH